MPSINISENDFTIVAGAAQDALERDDRVTAKALDKLARKINAALSNATVARMTAGYGGRRSEATTWQDMPSTLTDR